ncbi:MAG TPA: DUF4956 domain-containing protein, partial [Flavobacteriales bacterium]|nr:DUF4956 domain-containing protein [Flavobacteriales bacterium]
RHEAVRQLIYEKVDLIRPDKHKELLADLEQRLGIKVSRVEIGRIDLLRDTVQMRVFFFEDEQDLDGFVEIPPDNDD